VCVAVPGTIRLPAGNAAWYIRRCIRMPTTIHLPAALLRSVDRRAKALGVSRNRLIVRALERAVGEQAGWAPEYLEHLRQVDADTVQAVDELVNHVTQARRSKPPRQL
jgi:predicted transcriptional regulator